MAKKEEPKETELSPLAKRQKLRAEGATEAVARDESTKPPKKNDEGAPQ